MSKLCELFALKRIVLVGDRGMTTDARVRDDLSVIECLDWITALRAPAIAGLIDATERELKVIAKAVARAKRPLHGKEQIGLRVGKVLGRFEMGKRLRMHCLLACVDCKPPKTGVSFTWDGAWEYDQTSGSGRVTLRMDGRLKGGFRIKKTATRAPSSPSAPRSLTSPSCLPRATATSGATSLSQAVTFFWRGHT